jgi:hypothetical protein
MLWLALRQLLGRRTATLLAGGGLLIATLGFVTLVSTSQTLTTELSGDIARTWNTPYDLLVRPADSTTALEDERGLVRSNFLSALAGGGITPGQLEAVRRVPGVSVAAPVAVAGAVNWPAGGFGTDLSAEPAGDPVAVYRFSVSSIVDAGLSTYPVEIHYLILASEGVVRYPEGTRDAVLTVGGRRIDCAYPVSCFAPTVCEQERCGPAEDPPSYGLEILQPIVIAGIDPVAEAQLAGLDRCVTSGRYLNRADVPQPLSDRDPPGTRIPALATGGDQPLVRNRLNASMRPVTSAAALASSITGMPRTVTVTTLPSNNRRAVMASTSASGTELATPLTAPPMPSPIGEPMRRTSRDREVSASAIGLARMRPEACPAANARSCNAAPDAALPATACDHPRGRATKPAMTSSPDGRNGRAPRRNFSR